MSRPGLMFTLSLAACVDEPKTEEELSCEDETGCLDDALSIDEVATFEALSDGAGALLSAGWDVDGDGLEDAVIGGATQAWTLTGAGRGLVTTPLDLDLLGEGEHIGAVLALDGRAAIGAPDSSRILFSDGACLDGSSRGERLGASLSGWRTAIASPLSTAEGWELYVVGADALPGPGEEMALADLSSGFFRVPDLSDDASSPVLATASVGGGELAAGFPEAGGGVNAAVYNLSGSIELAFSIEDAEASALGASTGFWDVDQTSVSDLAVGDPDRGVVSLFLGGSAWAPLDEEDLRFTGPAGAGASLASADDLDGDGVEDLIIGGEDRVWLVLGWTEEGAPATIEASTIWTAAEGTGLGSAVASADLDGDGLSDLILGAPGASGVYVIWGEADLGSPR